MHSRCKFDDVLCKFQPNGDTTWPRYPCVLPDFLFRPLSTPPDNDDEDISNYDNNYDECGDDDSGSYAAASATGPKAGHGDWLLQSPSSPLRHYVAEEHHHHTIRSTAPAP